MKIDWIRSFVRYHALFQVLAAVLAGLLSVTARADAPVARIGYVAFPPYEYRDSQGQPAGSFIDLTRKVAIEAGYRPVFVYLPISRVYLYLRQGHIDLWPGLTHIPSLEGKVRPSATRPIHVELSAWHLKDTPPIRQFSDLRHQRLILISGYTYGGLAQYLADQGDNDLTYTSTHQAGVDMLHRRRGEYLLDYRDPVAAIGATNGPEGLEHCFIREREAAWLFSVEDTKSERMRQAFDAAYQRLKATGSLPLTGDQRPVSALPGFPMPAEVGVSAPE